MMTKTKALTGFAVIAAVIGGAALMLGARAAEEQPVKSALGLAAPGRVEPIGEERELGPRVPGLLVAVHVDENDHVEPGQILAEIERDDLLAELEAAKATVALERAERSRLINGARGEERREAEARMTASEAQLSWAEKEHQRRVKLAAQGAVTPSELDQMTKEVDSARARNGAAKERLALIEAPARTDELAMANAQLALAEARVRAVEAAIEKTYVRSPIAGTVLRRYRRAGEAVGTQPPTPLFVIGDVSRLMVRAEIDEIDVDRIQKGDRASVVADAFPSRRFAGRVARVGQRVGGKSVHTDRPAERQDRKVLEAMIELDPGSELPVGLRVDVFIDR